VTTFAQLRDRLAKQTTPDDTNYAVTKSEDEKQYTLGVLYVPGARDADNEFTGAEELQKATWDYFRSGYRGVRDTHTKVEIGELVELISWPFPVDAEAKLGDGTVKKYKLPAGSVFAGVVWNRDAWQLVKAGKLRGYSLGGKAVRMKEAATDDAMPRMAELVVQDDSVFEQPALKSKPSKEELSAALDVIARAIEVD
jgi:hypothetical protein